MKLMEQLDDGSLSPAKITAPQSVTVRGYHTMLVLAFAAARAAAYDCAAFAAATDATWPAAAPSFENLLVPPLLPPPTARAKSRVQ